MHRRRITAVTLATLLAGTTAFYAAPTIASVAGLTDPTTRSAVVEPAQPDATQRHAMDTAFDISEAFSYAAEKIEPSVVHVTTRDEVMGRRGSSALGSGVIVDKRGYIVTNNHVIETGRSITVRLSDGREVPAELVGTFPESDIAVLKVDADGLTPASFGDSEAMRVGQWVLAVGSPFGFDQTVTAGIVSAKGRGSFEPASEGDIQLQEYIQTDAAINPGNSGGPLVNLNGEVVGINTAIISRTGSNNGLGFAIPADIARSVMEQIIETGTVQRGWLGIVMKPLTPNDAHIMGIDGGVIVQEPLPDGPAEQAGLEAGDIIVSIGGRTTENMVRLSNAIMLTKPNEPIEIEYFRGGDHRTTSAVVANRDIEMPIARNGAYIEDIGVSVLPEQLESRGNRRIRVLPGFIITHLDASSPAARRGLEEGDFVYQVDNRAFDDADALKSYINASADRAVRIQFIRDGRPLYVDVTPQEP